MGSAAVAHLLCQSDSEALRKGIAALAEVCHKDMGVPERMANVALS